MPHFADWLSQTPLSLTIQTHAWVIPTVQSLHIVAIGVVLGSVLMMALRVMGWAGRDQTVPQTRARFGPWVAWALGVLLVTGVVMVIGEPVRELLAVSFWLKMGLVVLASITTVVFGRRGSRPLAMVTLLMWVAVVFLGRFIAYDYVWGSWSTALKG